MEPVRQIDAVLRMFLTGFVLALILTVLPFALVAYSHWPASVVVTVIAIAAVLQILVHLHYFLHLNASAEQYGKLWTAVFTAVILLIMVAGTMWIMFNLSSHMQP
jgi:cytochrome o ubiquinol oxidase operon protein cyoD